MTTTTTKLAAHHTGVFPLLWTRDQAARTAIMNYIEGWYNSRRPNRRAGGIAPATALAAARTAHQTHDQEPLTA